MNIWLSKRRDEERIEIYDDVCIRTARAESGCKRDLLISIRLDSLIIRVVKMDCWDSTRDG
jgi:hypothetical protein